MNYEEIEPYLLDYLKGNLDEGVEYRIKAYLTENPEYQKELDDLNDTLDYVKETPLLEPDNSLKMNFYTMLNSYQEKANAQTSAWQDLWQLIQTRFFIQRLALSALLIAIFVTGYWTSFLVNKPMTERTKKSTDIVSKTDDTQSEEESTGELFEAPREEKKPENLAFSESDKESRTSKEIAPSDIEEMDSPIIAEEKFGILEPERKFFSDIQHDREPESDERIKRVYTGLSSGTGLAANASLDEKIIAALINTLNTDPNPNVRMAAIDALERFANREKVKYQIAESLNNQNSPNLQLAAIDLIVKYQIKEGLNPLRKLLKKSGLNRQVREQAEIALELLS